MYLTLYAALTIEVMPYEPDQRRTPWFKADDYKQLLHHKDDPWHVNSLAWYRDMPSFLAACNPAFDPHEGLYPDRILKATSRYLPTEVPCESRVTQFLKLGLMRNEEFETLWSHNACRLTHAQDVHDLLLDKENPLDSWFFSQVQLYPNARALLNDHMLVQALAG